MSGEVIRGHEDEFANLSEEITSTGVTVYERLNPTNVDKAKAEFLANPTLVHPNYEQGNLDPDEVSRNLAKLDEIDVELQNSDLSDARRRLLGLIANDYRKQNEFLAANLAYNAATDSAEKAAAAEYHRQTNEALYGKPNEDTFYSLLRERLGKINYESLSDEEKNTYDSLISEIGPLKEGNVERFRPKPETVQRFAELVNYFFEGFLKHIPEKESYTPKEMCDIVNEILDQEFDDPDMVYRAEIKPGAKNASANHEDRRIYFPDDETKTYTPARAKALIVHELGSHVMRAIPYTDHEVAALSMGLPNNEEFDEGVAMSVEQAINGAYKDSGIDHYINIGLATFKGKNFRDIYNIECKLKGLLGENTSPVFNAVQRCFRGTAELPNNKDLAYYNGSNRVWKYIEEHIDDPELFDHLFMTGKIDYENPDQEAVSYEVRTKGI